MSTRKTFQKIFVILNAFIFLLGTLGTFWRIRIIDFYFGNSIAAGITIYTSVFSVLIYFILKIKKLADYKFSLKFIFYAVCILLWIISAYYCCYGIHWNLTSIFGYKLAIPTLAVNLFFALAAESSSILALAESIKSMNPKGGIKMNEEKNEQTEISETAVEENKNKISEIRENPTKEDNPPCCRQKAGFGLFVFLAVACFAVGAFFAYKAYDIKIYPYAERYRYVGGDAYNLIINSNFFTGYLISSVASFLGGILSSIAAGIINAVNKI